MKIISFHYVILTVFTLLAYGCVPMKYRWGILLTGSIIFVIAGSGWMPLALMSASVAVAWASAAVLEKKKYKWLLIAAIIIEFGMLFILKDSRLPAGMLSMEKDSMRLLVPVGISYYTLSLTGYLLDVYWDVQAAQKNPCRLALFAGFFPVLTSGPIMRYQEAADELFSGHKLSYEQICLGLQRILLGLFKKLVISERAAVIVNTIYENPAKYPGLYIWLAIFLFVVQLYTDFSGCMDMILGMAQMFGIILPENFNLPFASGSVAEFWRRWHMTLGAWLKNYVLYTLLRSTVWEKMAKAAKQIFGKKVGKKIPIWAALFFSWTFIGVWHGSTLNYIFGTGWYFWLVIVSGELCEPLFQKITGFLKIRIECFSWRLFQYVRTIFLVSVGWSFFRSYKGFLAGIDLYKKAFSVCNPWIFFDGSLYQLGLDDKDFHVMIASLLALLVIGCFRLVNGDSVRKRIMQQNLVFRYMIWLGLLFAVIIFGMYGPGYDAQAFIYQAF